MTAAAVLCRPRYQSYVWGGRNLARVLGRDLPPTGTVAESWEVSDLDGSVTELECSTNLRDWIAREPDEVLGRAGYVQLDGSRRFPLLVKFLDAATLLSVQVHPGDEYAREHEHGSPGKSEMWLILDAQPGAEVFAGLERGVGRDDLARALERGEPKDVLRRHAVAPGDVVSIPAGRVHALGAGVVVLEIQQTSSVTYRLHDWGRVGADGKPRELHIEKALAVTDFADESDPLPEPVAHAEEWGVRLLLALTRHFAVESYSIEGTARLRADSTSPEAIVCVRGDVTLQHSSNGAQLTVPHGRTAVVPTSAGEYSVVSRGKAMVVRARVPALGNASNAWGGYDPMALPRVCDGWMARRLQAERTG